MPEVMPKINWGNLKHGRCPKCGSRMLNAHYYMRCENRKGGVYKVKQSSKCTFTILKTKYRDLGGILRNNTYCYDFYGK